MSLAATTDLANVDLSDLSLWRDDAPHELFALLRQEAPVHWSPLGAFADEAGFWSLTRAADIREASRDWRTLSSEVGGPVMVDDIGVPLDVMRLQILSMDPPNHTRLKALFQRAFTPKRIADHTDQIRKIVTAAIDEVIERGECDLVEDVASRVTARVIGSLLGTPPEDDERLVRWSQLTVGFEGDEELRPESADLFETLNEIVEYVVPRVKERRDVPTGDLLSAMAHAEIGGDRLNDLELTTFFGLLMAAGNDSTKAVYGHSVVALCRHPDQRRLLVEEPGRIQDAVEECLRCFPAFAHFRRTATEDVELHGETIRKGDKVLLWYISGNRDESVYEHPQQFDVTRSKVEHMSFGGGGRHFCLGAALARLELRVLLEETLRRMPEIELAGPPRRTPSAWVNQYKSIPIRFPAGPREG